MRVLPFRDESHFPQALVEVRQTLANHGVVAIPTETFYGLAVDPLDPKAMRNIFRLKERGAEKALPLVGASLEQLAEVVIIPEVWRARLRHVWPGPLSVVLPTQPAWAKFGPTAAVRVPAQPLLRQLLASVGPLTATSANRSGEPPAQTLAQLTTLAPGLALALDAGPTPGGLPSTIFDLTSPSPRILRPGAFPVPLEWVGD